LQSSKKSNCICKYAFFYVFFFVVLLLFLLVQFPIFLDSMRSVNIPLGARAPRFAPLPFLSFFLLHAFIIVAFVSIVPAAWAQTGADERKLRMAESYEQSGDMKNAARIYQELYDGNKTNSAYFDGVVRTLQALGQPASLLPLVEEQIPRAKAHALRQTELFALKGELLWKTGKTTQAEEAWKQALDIAPNTPQAFSLIARSQASNRAFELAISTLTAARARLSSPAIFSDDLSQLYGAVGNYVAGTQEALIFLRQTNNLNVAQGRVAAYLITSKGVEQTREVLEKAASAEPTNITLQRLYSWFLREVKDYNRALDVSQRLDNILNAQGREILMFAEKARQEQFYDAALRGYEIVIDKGKTNPHALSAFYGYARALEGRLQEAKTSGDEAEKRLFEQIIARYRAVAADYPGTQYAAESQYRIALTLNERLGSFAAAEQEYQTLLKQYRAFPIAARGSVDLGRLYIRQNRLDKASETFQATLQFFSRSRKECDEAEFHLAELEYFRGDLDSAERRLNNLAANANADIANDALERLATLELRRSGGESEAAVKQFAVAELFERQAKNNEAVEAFTALGLSAKPSAPYAVLGEHALLKAGLIELGRKSYADATKLFVQMRERFPDGVLGDYAAMYEGDILALQGRKDEAIQTYSQALAKFPRSTLLQQIRLKIRKLRGDA
jgi:tetratricopeptide (TPR) repeat protein